VLAVVLQGAPLARRENPVFRREGEGCIPIDFDIIGIVVGDRLAHPDRTEHEDRDRAVVPDEPLVATRSMVDAPGAALGF